MCVRGVSVHVFVFCEALVLLSLGLVEVRPGFVELWSCRPLVFLSFGFVDSWSCGILVLSSAGLVKRWSCSALVSVSLSLVVELVLV